MKKLIIAVMLIGTFGLSNAQPIITVITKEALPI